MYTQVYALFGGTAGQRTQQQQLCAIFDKFHVAGRPGVAMAATLLCLFAIILFAVPPKRKAEDEDEKVFNVFSITAQFS